MSAVGRLIARRRQRVPAYLADLFPKQRAFFDDGSKLKAALCGRRAGKTVACAAGLHIAAAERPGLLCPYITLTSVMARRIMWPVLKWFNERYSLGMRMDNQELVAYLPNGSQIFLVGGDNVRKVEALRGAPYPRVVIDEGGSFPRALLRYLMDDVLDAALMDYDGDMWIVGTPNAACAGHFHDLTTGKNPDVAKVPTHHWTVLDNVHLPHSAERLERKRAEKKWTLDNPVYRREYMGQWVRDLTSMVFRFDRARHLILPEALPKLVGGNIGADLGVSDKVASTAFVPSGWAHFDRTVYTVSAAKFASMNPETAAEEVTRIRAKLPWVRHIVVDEGGLGKGYADMWRTRCNLPAIPAEKRQKLVFIEFLNGELDADRIKLVEGPTRPLVEEIELLQWNEDRDDFDDRFADHASDAWLYSWRDCYAWLEKTAPANDPEPGSPEWTMREAARLKAEVMRRAARRDKRQRTA